MTRRRSSPLGLELVLSVVLALVLLPLLSHGAPVQESHDLQRYSEGCYYNYNHYSEGDRILTNEPCLNCTCHNKMLMCYLRVCPFTKPIGHDCTVEKREDQCCPIVTCPEVPVDIAHHSHQLTTSAPGTELSIPEKYGCSIDNKFYVEGAQVPSNPNKPCELCYCIRNRTACLMQECTLHIDGCQPIYNKGSCCPVRYNCDHENELLEIEDFSTTTTTVRPTEGYLLPSTTSPSVTTDCIHNNEVYADGASITGKSSCEHCYCMRGDIVCAVQECEMPTLESGTKTCRALPPAAGECCPSNYECDDDSVTTEGALSEDMPTTITPLIQSNLHESVSQEDVKLQEHIDDKIPVTEVPESLGEQQVAQKDEIKPTTISPITGDVSLSTAQEVKVSEGEEEKPHLTTISAIKETSFETTQSPTDQSITHKTEEGLESSHEDKEDESVHPPKEDEIINEENEDISQTATTVSPVVGDIQEADSEEEVLPTRIPDSSPEHEVTTHSIVQDDLKIKEEEDLVPSTEHDVKSDQGESTLIPEDVAEKDDATPVDIKKPESDDISTTLTPADKSEDVTKLPAAETTPSTDADSENMTPEIFVPSKDHTESEEKDKVSTELPAEISKQEFELENVSSSTFASVEESEDVNKTPATEVTPQTDSASETADTVTSVPSKPHIEPQETSSESVEFSEESTTGQEESQDKIDENISEASFESSTSSPIFETITEGGDNIHIAMPETDDHKTESDLPKKKPKDEQESMEDVPVSSDTNKDEIPQVIIDGVTENIVDISTSIPTRDGIDSNELATTKSSVLKDEEILDQSTQGTIEEKPAQESEIPAVVEEITNAPISGDIPDENEEPLPTTVLPVKDSHADESIESQEEELSTESSDSEKRTSTSRPIRIHIDGEKDSSEITTKGTEEEFVDSTTSLPSIDDSVTAISEKEEDLPAVDSEKPTAEEVPFKEEEDTTIKMPSALDVRIPTVEDGDVAPEKETEILKDESSTTTPLKTSESETKVPFELETSSIGQEEIEGKPHSDFTTVIPSIEDSEKEHVEDKIQPEQNIPTSSDSEPTSVEEKVEKETEQSLIDSTTKHPSVGESEDIITVEYETKTKTPLLVDHIETSADEDNVTHDPELHIPSTVTPSKSKPSEDSSTEEHIEGEQESDTSDSTTINPIATGSEIPSAEEDILKKPAHEKETSDDNISTESSFSSATTDITDIEKQPEQGDSDSTVPPRPISDASESTEEHKIPASAETDKDKPSTQDISDLSTAVPSIEVSEEGVKQETENNFDDLTTVSPSASDNAGSTDEEIKKQPEQELVDSSTKTSVSTSPGESAITDQEAQPTTTSASLVDSETPIPEAGDKDKNNEISEDASSTGTPSPADSETFGQVTDAPIIPISGEIASPTTAVPQPIESQEPIKEDAHDEQSIGETSVTPTAHSDKESVDTTEESFVPMHDIIPSAIPGEGDCLANGETFANNATVPTSSECEISCTCIRSIIVCNRVQCYEPPKPNNCVLDEASTDKCCPQYICGIDSFTGDQRPTTPEEIEDEEIQFTTLTPSSKYPDLSSESATHKTEHDEPINQDESSKTELPISFDENTTPVSVDFEQPAVIPEDPLSHVKVDEVEESSTKHSDEDKLVEESTTTAQPITAKPTKQVTGDIEQPIEVTSSVPESISPQKPEEISTLGATDYEEQKPTTPKSVDGELSSSDSENEPSKPVVPSETVQAEGSPETQATTIQPTKADVSTEGASIPSVIQTDDSTQSEEIPETSDETSNESGEETDSEEDTKSPLLHKDEDQTITTFRPLVSEHIGDIEPLDEITTIPEIDYQKPEMPEDLSHTKVEDETQTETEKPVKHIETEESVENEQATEKIITTPASTILTRVEPTEDDAHKVETAAEISNKKDDIPSLESEENEQNEDKPIHSTISPVSLDEKPASETVTESKKDEIEEHTISPKPESEEDIDLESQQTPSQTIAPARDEEKPIAGTIIPEEDETIADIIPSTSAPVIEEHSVEESDENVSEEGSGDKQQDVVSSTTSTIDQTLVPISSDETSEEKDKIPISSSTPAIDGHTTIADSQNDIEDEEIHSETSAPPKEEQSIEGSGAPISEGKPNVEQNEFTEQASTPAIEKQPSSSDSEEENEIDVTTVRSVADHTVEDSGASSLGEGDKSERDEIVSQTSVPQTDEKPSTSDSEEEIKIEVAVPPAVDGSGATIPEDNADIEQDEIASTSTPPTIDTHHTILDLEEQNKIDVTTSPVIEEGSGAPISEDKTDVELDDTVSQTSTPAVEKQPSISDLGDQNKISVISSPATDEDSVEGSGAPVSEDKTDVEQSEITSQTTVPTIEKQPSISDSDEEIKIDVTSSPEDEEGSGAPISEDKTDTEQDELATHTSSPDVDKQPIASDSEDTNKLEEPSTEGSVPNKEHMGTQTEVPLIEDNVTVVPVSIDELHSISSTIAPVVDLETNEVISSQTNAPGVTSEEESNEDKTSVESQTDTPTYELNDKFVPQTTEKESHDSTLPSEEGENTVSQTVAPLVGDKHEETDLTEDQKPTVLVPISEKDNESEITTVSPDVKDESLDVLEGSEGSIPPKDMEASDENTDATEAPAKDTSLSGDEYVGSTDKTPTSAPVITSDEDSSATEDPSKDTSSVVSGDEHVGITEDSAVSTPIKTIDEKESTEENKTISPVIPIKTVDVDSDNLDSTEHPSSSSPSKPIDNIDDDLAITESPELDSDKVHTSDETALAESEPVSPVTVSGDEVFIQTESSLTPVSHVPEEGVSIEHSEEQSSGETELTDKTLITTESSLPASETVSPSVEIYIEDKTERVQTDKPSTPTKLPELLDAETSTKSKDESESINATTMPEIISSHEITQQSGKPESDNQIQIEDTATVKPSADEVSTQTESSSDKNKPSSEESEATTKVPAIIDVSEINEQPEKPESDEEESAEDITQKPSLDAYQTTIKLPTISDAPGTNEQSEKQESGEEDTVSKTPQFVGQTESPVTILSEQDVPSEDTKPEDVDRFPTDKPIDDTASTESLEEDGVTKQTTSKPTEDVHPTKSDEQDGEHITSSPVDVHVDSDVTYSTEKSDEDKEHTPKDDTKIQTIEEIVTEHAEDITTALPTHDKEHIPEEPISEESPEKPTKEKETPVISTTSEADESEEKIQVTEVPVGIPAEDTKPQVQPTSLPESEESEEKELFTEVPAEIPVEDTKPQVQPTSLPESEESEEKELITEIPAEIPVEDTKPQVQPTSLPESEESEEKEQITEVPAEISVEDTKPQVQPTSLPESEESEEKEQITEVPAEIPVEDTKPQVQPTSLPESEESEEKEQITEVPAKIPTEDTKPQVHPTSSDEESNEKTEAPEIISDITKQPGTGSISEFDEKTQAPETQHEITEEDHKQHVQPTEGSTAPSATDKPIEQIADDKIDSDLPKPIVQDEQPSSEDETPLSTTIHPLFPHIEHDRTTSTPLNATDKDSSSPPVPTTEQPSAQAITNAPTNYQPPGYGQVPPQYPSYTEDEYTDEDETEVFGPGTCRYGGKLFVSAQQIPRDDPCDFCFCFRSDIICLQQSCPPPISGCHEEPISGFCCPRYECPVSMATTLNITTSTTTTSTTLPPHFLHHAYRGAAAKNGCHINGKSYKVGDKIDSASGPCMHCTCGGDGQMKCDPKTCSPEPMLRQMIAVVASRRR